MTTDVHLSYTMERADFLALTKAMTPATARATLLRALLILAGCGLGFVVGTGFQPALAFNELLTLTAPSEAYAIMSSLALVVLFLIFGARPLFLRAAAASAYRRSAAAGQIVTFDVDDTEIVARQPGVSSTVAWSAVVRLIQTPDHLFVAISRREAFILARRAFASAAAFSDFAGWARGHIAATSSPSAG